ncbi:MAG: ATP-binding protein [Nannocystaceae bacterium]|nr:ATP-binding protein [bacterium]
MKDDLDRLEKELLEHPFDTERRRTYAKALMGAGRVAEAGKQFELLGEPLPAPPSDAAVPAASGLHLVPADAAASAEVEHETIGFDDIVGMEEVKKTVRLRIIEPFKNPGLFARFRKKRGGGVMLYGPPGCGKTMLARAVAHECNATFIGVGISEVLNMWIGESERLLSAFFERARAERPAVLFFDELDALAFSRSKARSEHSRTRVNEFLAQLDGMDADNDQLLVLGATNMPWDVDPAMKRPGRFDRQVFVPPPDASARAEMFRVKLFDIPTEALDFRRLAEASPNASGADIDGMIELAKEHVLDEILSGGTERPMRDADLLAAVRDTEPSTVEWLRTAENLVKYGSGGGQYKELAAFLRTVKF